MKTQSRYQLDMQGWCDFQPLYQCAVDLLETRTDRPMVVEVGVWKGASICILAKLLRAVYRREFLLFAVDLWSMEIDGKDTAVDKQRKIMLDAGIDLHEQYMHNIRYNKVQHLIKTWREDSVDAAGMFRDATCDFVFIDADHTEESVYRDVMAWHPKAMMMAGHDIHLLSVKTGLQRSGIEYFVCPKVDCWTTSKMLASAVNAN